ncbi:MULTISPECIES: hypothetical protein [Flavobacteriaceae]|uniref:hypothetical protein n=1 Tax=Flavobacteriaceae TaxID=49546 RepID=UPI0010AE12E8|nr:MULTISPECIES: hypothetical protein [Flavobacteriaceae]NJB38111.1 hypothetical protein [Croceivirga sp. JEA036]TKD59024.1 hypothetical protein FBT53_14665 [Flavobacterium sp. ASW18X]
MAFTATKRVVQTVGKYTNSKGEEKTQYQDLGTVFENEKGYESIKLTALPLPNEKGEVWINLYPIDKK